MLMGNVMRGRPTCLVIAHRDKVRELGLGRVSTELKESHIFASIYIFC